MLHPFNVSAAISMRLTIICIAVFLILCGCRTQQLSRPINPEALGLNPKMDLTPEETEKLYQDANKGFTVILGEPSPTRFSLSAPTVGWFTEKGELRQLRASAKLPRKEFRAPTASKGWREIAIPREYLEPMHLPANVPKNYMTCYVGMLNGKPAYLFWSDYGESAMLVVDY